MADKIAIKRTAIDGKTEVVYDPITNQIIKDPTDQLIVSEDMFKGGEIDPNKPNAVPRIVRGEDGMNYTIWVDVKTGAEVTNLSKYNILDTHNSNIQELGLIRVVDEKEQKKVEEKASTERPHGERRGEWNIAGKDVRRDMTNNFGYVNRPDIMNYAGFIGGPLGMVAKGANIALNASNTQAVSAAQKNLGFTNDQNKLGQILKDKQGYIGDLSYNGTTTAVGLEAEDNLGRTTLTPNEARMRQALLGATQSTPKQQEMNVDQFKEENPGIIGKAKGLLAKVFGQEEEKKPSAIHETGTYTGPNYTGVTGTETEEQTSSFAPSSSSPIGHTMGYTAAQTKERYNSFTDEDKQAMAQTLAGEIDFSQTDLSTPEGLQEAYGILSTMENRATKYGSVKNAAFAPSQYSTWNNPQVSNVAKRNYQKNQDLIDSIVENYTATPDYNMGYTSYYNPSIASPAWGPAMENATQIGPHKFGNLSEYGTNPYTNGFAAFGQQLQSYEDDRQTRAPRAKESSLNTAAQNAYRDLDSWYSGPKGVVGPRDSGFSKEQEDRSTRASKSETGYGSMADGRKSDRESMSGYSSGSRSYGSFGGFSEDRSDRASKVDKSSESRGKGFGSNFGGFSEDRSDRASKADRSTGSGFSSGSMAAGRNSDRSSVGGYSGSNKSFSGRSKGSESRSDGWT